MTLRVIKSVGAVCFLIASTNGICNPELQQKRTPSLRNNGLGIAANRVTLPQPVGDEAIYPAALDGSPYVFFNGKGTSSKWTINLQGGGWCYDEADCFCRSSDKSTHSLGSSKGYPSAGKCSCANPLPDGSTDNTCNCIDLPYLDGASFAGYRAEPHNVPNSNEKTWFRGIKNLDATLEWAFANTDIQNATELVVVGESAGGLATFLHADRIVKRVTTGAPNCKKAVAHPIVGFFLDHDNFEHSDGYPGGPNTPQWSPLAPDVNRTGANYTSWMKYIYTMQNLSFAEDGGLMPECQAKHPDHPYLCFMSPHMVDVIKTPLFMINSRFDHWQLQNIFQAQYPAGAVPEENGVLEYGASFLSQLAPVTAPGSPHGGSICTCICHGCPWPDMIIDGKTTPQHYSDWFYGVTKPGADSMHIDHMSPNHGGAYNSTNPVYHLCRTFTMPPSM